MSLASSSTPIRHPPRTGGSKIRRRDDARSPAHGFFPGKVRFAMRVSYRATRSAEWVVQQGGVSIALEMLASEALLMLGYAAEDIGLAAGAEDVEITYDALTLTWDFVWSVEPAPVRAGIFRLAGPDAVAAPGTRSRHSPEIPGRIWPALAIERPMFAAHQHAHGKLEARPRKVRLEATADDKRPVAIWRRLSKSAASAGRLSIIIPPPDRMQPSLPWVLCVAGFCRPRRVRVLRRIACPRVPQARSTSTRARSAAGASPIPPTGAPS